jgi:hypothetical protein
MVRHHDITRLLLLLLLLITPYLILNMARHHQTVVDAIVLSHILFLLFSIVIHMKLSQLLYILYGLVLIIIGFYHWIVALIIITL